VKKLEFIVCEHGKLTALGGCFGCFDPTRKMLTWLMISDKNRDQRTNGYFGGERAWFLCPRPGCGRRVAKLWGGTMFYCRQCYNLAYESQNETAWDRALRKHQAIRMRLGGSGSLAEDFPDKPKGMHWQTYWRLCRAAEEAESRSWPPWIYKMIARSNAS